MSPAPCVEQIPSVTEGSVEESYPGVAERIAWTLVWIGVLIGGLNAWGEWTASPSLTVLSIALTLAAIAGIVSSWLSKSPRSRGFQLAGLGAVVVSIVASQYGPIHTRIFYTTDAAAFNHVAAQALVHGKDPYSVSMSGARALLDFADRYWTYTANGGHITNVSYPAGSFLVIVPAMLLGIHHQVVDWVDLVAWLATGVLIFALLPKALRWLAGLLTLTPLFVGVFSNGGTDATYLPFMVLALWRWDRYGSGRDAGVARWIGPVALGLACAIKQSPWFCVPFLVVGIAFEARRNSRRPARAALGYAGTVLGVFGAVNLPFIVWHPGSWLHGTLTPFVQPIVADGQGLVSLATHGIVRSVDLHYLTACGLLVYLAVFAVFVTNYARMKRVWLVVVPLSMFFSTRSLSSYLIDFIPAAVIAAFTVSGLESEDRWLLSGDGARRTRAWVPAGLCLLPVLGAALTAVLAFLNPPLAITVRHFDTSADGVKMTDVTVSLRNLTDATLVPHVLVVMGQHPAGYWLPRDGEMQQIPAHSQVTVTLYPPTVTYTAVSGMQWLVAAYTVNPTSMSASVLQEGTRPPPP